MGRFLVVDINSKDCITWALKCAKKLDSNSDIIIYSRKAQAGKSIYQYTTVKYNTWPDFWKELRQHRSEAFKLVLLPFKASMLRNLNYWIVMGILLLSRVGIVQLVSEKGLVLHSVCKAAYCLAKPIYLTAKICVILITNCIVWLPNSIINIIRLPQYVRKQVIKNFVLANENKNDEFVGFGKRKGCSGLVYWLTLVNKAKKFGLFGLAHDSYWGMPLSVHFWPFSLAALRYLRFRGVIYSAALLISTGLVWLSISTDHPWMCLLIPFALFSNYFIFNIYAGTLELLAWGFGALSFSAMYNDMPILGGIFIACALLSHPGVSFLSTLTICGYFILSGYSLLSICVMFITLFLFSLWFLVPYLRSRDKQGRSEIINVIYKYQYKWSRFTIYNFSFYALFFSFLFYRSNFLLENVIFALPLFVTFYNVKINWLFSNYTISNFILILGLLFLFLNPNLVSIFIFLLIIYSDPRILFGALNDSKFDLTPIIATKNKAKINQLFSEVESGRVLIEMGERGVCAGWECMPFIAYALSNKDIDIFNMGYVEVGDSALYYKYCARVSPHSSDDDFVGALRDCGIKYIIAITETYINRLRQKGFKLVGYAENMNMSLYPADKTVNLYLFELPWEAEVIQPPTEIRISPNQIKFSAKANTNYILKYTYFKGWRAFQNARRIEIKDAMPGMIIYPQKNGIVTLKYKYTYYWH